MRPEARPLAQCFHANLTELEPLGFDENETQRGSAATCTPARARDREFANARASWWLGIDANCTDGGGRLQLVL